MFSRGNFRTKKLEERCMRVLSSMNEWCFPWTKCLSSKFMFNLLNHNSHFLLEQNFLTTFKMHVHISLKASIGHSFEII